MCEMCSSLHSLLHEGKRFDHSYDCKEIPANGIYIMFEKGEIAHAGDRIVRIGIHVKDNRLKYRLDQHYKKENKNRSIFRKHIGRCFLNRGSDGENKNHCSSLIDKEYDRKIEEDVSRHINENISFCLLAMPSEKHRRKYEARLIGTVSACRECTPSEDWLGRFSPKDNNGKENKITVKGLWQKQHLNSAPLENEDLAFIAECLVRIDGN